jgi:hypothetical protein
MIDRLFRAAQGLLDPGPTQPAPSDTGEPLRPRVLLIVHNPPVAAEGGRRLAEIFGWNDPDQLARQYVADLAACSYGYVRYQIVERIRADWFPRKLDGFRYTGEEYVRAWRAGRMHEPDNIDYEAQVAAFDLIGRYERDEFDEVWFLTFPYAGDYESTMVGRGAFWCNSPPVPNTGHCAGRFVMMGFNYERGVECMLENFGHRAESIMGHVFQNHPREQNLWERFTHYDQIAPGQSQCGNVHFAPNSERDYDWGNRRPVWSFCDNWYRFPELHGNGRTVTCAEWGEGDMRAHHLWWLRHLPHVAGETHGVSNNWWQYIVLVRNPDHPGRPPGDRIGR